MGKFDGYGNAGADEARARSIVIPRNSDYQLPVNASQNTMNKRADQAMGRTLNPQAGAARGYKLALGAAQQPANFSPQQQAIAGQQQQLAQRHAQFQGNVKLALQPQAAGPRQIAMRQPPASPMVAAPQAGTPTLDRLNARENADRARAGLAPAQHPANVPAMRPQIAMRRPQQGQQIAVRGAAAPAGGGAWPYQGGLRAAQTPEHLAMIQARLGQAAALRGKGPEAEAQADKLMGEAQHIGLFGAGSLAEYQGHVAMSDPLVRSRLEARANGVPPAQVAANDAAERALRGQQGGVGQLLPTAGPSGAILANPIQAKANLEATGAGHLVNGEDSSDPVKVSSMLQALHPQTGGMPPPGVAKDLGAVMALNPDLMYAANKMAAGNNSSLPGFLSRGLAAVDRSRESGEMFKGLGGHVGLGAALSALTPTQIGAESFMHNARNSFPWNILSPSDEKIREQEQAAALIQSLADPRTQLTPAQLGVGEKPDPRYPQRKGNTPSASPRIPF